MEFEYLPFQPVILETPLRDANLLIATITFVSCFYLFAVLLYWWKKLKKTNTSLRPLILSFSLMCGSAWYWSISGIMQIMVFDTDLPIVTLPARLIFLFSAITAVIVTMKYYHKVDEIDPPGPFQKI